MRNPHIAEILHETRFAETKGSGLRVMRDIMASHGLSVPTFSSNRDNDEFAAIFLFHHFLSETDWIWLAAFNSFQLSEDQMRALIFVREVGAIDNSAYRSLTQVDTLSASKSLRKLREQDILEDKGSGSRTYYVPGRVMRERALADNAAMDAKTGSADGKARMPSRSEIPTPLRARLESLGRRIEPAEMERLLVDLCAWTALSAEEIASLLGKTSNYISNRYLYRMAKDGRLQYKYPEMLKHPGQRYLTPSI